MRASKDGMLAELALVPSHVAEALQDLNQLMVPELKRRGRQEQHAVERMRHRAVAGSKFFIRSPRL